MRPAIYNRLFKLDGGYELTMPNSYSSGIRFRFGGIVRLMIMNVIVLTVLFERTLSALHSAILLVVFHENSDLLPLISISIEGQNLPCICPLQNRDWRRRMLTNSTCLKAEVKAWAHYLVPRVSRANGRLTSLASTWPCFPNAGHVITL